MSLYCCLVRILKDGKIESHIIEADKFFLGRSPDSAILMPDQSVSRQHLGIVVKNGKILIKDSGSANGTTVDGKKLDPESIVVVEPNQKIKLGKSEIVFTLECIPRKINLKNLDALGVGEETRGHLEEALLLAQQQIKKHEKDVELLFDKVKKERENKQQILFEQSQKKAEAIIHEANVTAQSILESAYKKEAEVMIEAEKKGQASILEIQQQAQLELKAVNEKANLIEKEFHEKGKSIIENSKSIARENIDSAKLAAEKIKLDAQAYADEKRKESHMMFDKVLAEAEVRKNEIISLAKKDSENIKLKSKNEIEDLILMHENQFLIKVKNFDEECELTRKKLAEELKDEVEKLEKIKRDIVRYTELNAQALAKHNDSLAELQSLKTQLSEHELERQRVQTTIDSFKKEIEILKEMEASLKQTQEKILLDNNALKNKIDVEKEAWEKEFYSHKERVLSEFHALKKKEKEDLENFKQQQLEDIEKQRDASLVVVHKYQKQFVKGVAYKLGKEILSQLKITDQQIPTILHPDELEKIVNEAYLQQSVEDGQVLEENVEIQVGVHTKKRVKSIQRWALAATSAMFAILFVYSLNGGSVANLIKGLNQQGETAAEAYGRERREYRENNKFRPLQTYNLKSTYTDNILYTKNYAELKLDNQIQEKWIRDLNQYMSIDLGVDEDSIVKIIATENTLVNRLLEEREQVNPEFLSLSLDKMKKIEKESVEEIQNYLKDPFLYKKFQNYSEKYWHDLLKARNPASN